MALLLVAVYVSYLISDLVDKIKPIMMTPYIYLKHIYDNIHDKVDGYYEKKHAVLMNDKKEKYHAFTKKIRQKYILQN